MGTLFIELEDNLLHRAEKQSERLGKSLSELVEELLADFAAPSEASEPKNKSLFGAMRGTAEIVGDIVSPLPDEDWEVLRS